MVVYLWGLEVVIKTATYCESRTSDVNSSHSHHGYLGSGSIEPWVSTCRGGNGSDGGDGSDGGGGDDTECEFLVTR